MSQETMINNLSGNINEEDSKLVDSILNDLNMVDQSDKQVGTQPAQPEITQEQKDDMLMRQKQIMKQQEMLQQNQQMAPNMNVVKEDATDRLLGKVRNESKSIMLVISLAILFNIEQVNGIFKKWPEIFMAEGGVLNMQAIFIKAILIGIVYFLVKSHIF